MKCLNHPLYEGKSRPKSNCSTCQEIYKMVRLEKENRLLHSQLKSFVYRERISLHRFRTQIVKFGVVGDTHLGSYYERLDFLNVAYKVFEVNKIQKVFHAGDILDGEKMYRGHEYELRAHGADRQIAHCVENYPQRGKIITHFITGNHDLSFWRHAGIDIGEKIALQRKDMVYEGQENARIEIYNKDGHIFKLMLEHPGKGTAYAISYHPQKYIESLSGGQKPHAILMGHYHKAEFLPNYRNVCLIQVGTLQSQTPFMRRNNIAAMMGFWIVEVRFDAQGTVSLKPEFYPFFEKEVNNEQR